MKSLSFTSTVKIAQRTFDLTTVLFQSRPTPYHDKVTLYAGIEGHAGTGDIWAINPLVTQMPSSGDYNAQVHLCC
jgi:hypothetical protein